ARTSSTVRSWALSGGHARRGRLTNHTAVVLHRVVEPLGASVWETRRGGGVEEAGVVGDSFTHLHVHTEYSMLDGASRLNELVAAAVTDGQPALGITDHGNMY